MMWLIQNNVKSFILDFTKNVQYLAIIEDIFNILRLF